MKDLINIFDYVFLEVYNTAKKLNFSISLKH